MSLVGTELPLSAGFCAALWQAAFFWRREKVQGSLFLRDPRGPSPVEMNETAAVFSSYRKKLSAMRIPFLCRPVAGETIEGLGVAGICGCFPVVLRPVESLCYA